MKYLIKGTAVKFNHKVYEIGDEITLKTVPKSITHLLQPVKEPRILSDLPASGVGASTELRRSAEVSKKTRKRKNKTEK